MHSPHFRETNLPVREKNPILRAVYSRIDIISHLTSVEDFDKKDIKSIQSDDILNFIFKSYHQSKKDLVYHLEKIYHYHSFAFNQAREALLNIFSSLFLTIIQTYHPEYRRQHMRCIFNLLLFAVLSIHFFAASIYIYKTLTIFSIICSVGLVSALLLTFHRYQSINHFFNNIAHKLANTFIDQIKNNLDQSTNQPPINLSLVTLSKSINQLSDHDSDSSSDKTDKESNDGSPQIPDAMPISAQLAKKQCDSDNGNDSNTSNGRTDHKCNDGSLQTPSPIISSWFLQNGDSKEQVNGFSQVDTKKVDEAGLEKLFQQCLSARVGLLFSDDEERPPDGKTLTALRLPTINGPQ